MSEKVYAKLDTKKYNFNEEAREVFGLGSKDVIMARIKNKELHEPEMFNIWFDAKHLERIFSFYSMDSLYRELALKIWGDGKKVISSGTTFKVCVMFSLPNKKQGSYGFDLYDVFFDKGYPYCKNHIEMMYFID